MSQIGYVCVQLLVDERGRNSFATCRLAGCWAARPCLAGSLLAGGLAGWLGGWLARAMLFCVQCLVYVRVWLGAAERLHADPDRMPLYTSGIRWSSAVQA